MHPVISDLDALVLDLDGVIYRGDMTVPGSPEAVTTLRAEGKRLLFLTNNSRRTEADVVTKLAAHGVEASEREVLTSGKVTAEWLSARGPVKGPVFVIGGDGIRSALVDAGFELADRDDGARAAIVVVGFDRNFDYATLRVAADAVRAGATFVATNGDPTFPTPTGLIPGGGALVAAVEVASGCSAEVMGKPNRPMMEAAAARLGGADRIGIVGDQPITDLEGGRAMGWTTILVLSGVVGSDDAAAVRPSPDLIAQDLAALAGDG